MIFKTTEKGQALILITLAAVGLFAFSALAIDGSRVYSDKRHAQNAADSAALAGALAYTRNNSITLDSMRTIAQARVTSNGYDDNGTSNEVTITWDSVTSGCPSGKGKDITVTIVSHLDTTIARVIGRNQVTTAVTATTRACDYAEVALFDGNAIVGLNPSTTHCAIDTGNSGAHTWTTTGGGVFSNGCLQHTNGDLNVSNDKCTTAVGTATVTGGGTHTCVQGGQTAKRYNYPSDIAAMMPPNPCDGTPGDVGITPTTGQTTFNNGIYCIDNPATFFGSPYHGNIILNNATLYVYGQSFSMKFNGHGDFRGTATTTAGSPYKGYFMVVAMAPVTANSCQQNFEMRGNGDGDIVGTILAPSACFDPSGNSGTGANRGQMIFYHIGPTGGGNHSIKVDYDAGVTPKKPIDANLTLYE